MYDLSLGLSVLFSLLVYEGFGLLTGGMISSGYLSLYLDQPFRIITTLLLACAVCGLGRLLSCFMLFFGRRRFFFMLLAGMLLTWLAEKYLLVHLPLVQDLRIIGRLIPGLIANDMYRQGVVRTTLAVVLSAVLVRLCILAVGLL